MENDTQYPMIIIRVPHQSPPRGHVCENDGHLAELAYREGGDNWEWGDNPTTEDYLDAIGHDMDRTLTLCSQEEALAMYRDIMQGREATHQGGKVATQIRECCEFLNWWVPQPRHRIKLGPVSHGTQHYALIDDLEGELDYYFGTDRWRSLLDSGVATDYDGEEADYLEALINLLQSLAPAFCYFGATEGDGSDFGFWIDRDALETSITDGEIVKVNAGDDWPADLTADYVLEVTAHGNMALWSVANRRQPIWSAV